MNVLAGYIWDHWEDYRAGLYAPDTDTSRQFQALSLLGDPPAFLEAASEMVREWPNAAYHNLSNLWTGRNAWIGQASCCYVFGATSADTRAAWGLLPNADQRRANEVARYVRESWERGWRDAQAVLDL